ncbi:hypothetical protein FA95DRAFT_1463032, partial [Auriscalpium vulgare]
DCYDCASTGGCTRCGPKSSNFCCDLCNPAQFEDVARADVVKPPAQTRRSKIDTKYMPNVGEKSLMDGLLEWRSARAVEKFGIVHFDDFGPALFMPLSAVQLIVDSAHSQKIKKPSDILRQTKWAPAKRYGNQLFDIVLTHLPLP